MLKKLHFWLAAFPIVLSLLVTVLILTFFRFLPDKLPLFYSLPWGEKQLAAHSQFLIIPGSILLITLLNLTISSQLHNQQYFFKKALLFSSIIVSLILVITIIKIILLFI